jgi:hypothetical protein
MAKRRNPITGQWSARLIDMQRSFAWRVLSRAAHQCLSRIEIELADHGGNDINELPVTFNDFESYGVNRHAIGPALAELEALGFIDITERGRTVRAAEYRRSNKFRLLTRPWEGKGAAYRPRWERFQTLEEAEATAAEARRYAAKEKSASAETAPKSVRKPHHEGKKASAETAPLANVGKRTTIYISGGGGPRPKTDDTLTPPASTTAPPAPPSPAVLWAEFSPSTPRQPASDRIAGPGKLDAIVKTWKPLDETYLIDGRRIEAHDQTTRRNVGSVADLYERLARRTALPSNARHAVPPRLAVGVLTPRAPTLAVVH